MVTVENVAKSQLCTEWPVWNETRTQRATRCGESDGTIIGKGAILKRHNLSLTFTSQNVKLTLIIQFETQTLFAFCYLNYHILAQGSSMEQQLFAYFTAFICFDIIG